MPYQQLRQVPTRAAARPKLTLEMATSTGAVRAAQRLRYQVFAEELGARLACREPGLDQDIFDSHCQHLIVRDEHRNAVVGTYRILTPEAARRVGAYYSESEFDLVRLANLRSGLVEIGRSCIHPDFRSGAVIALLWQGLAEFMRQGGYSHLMGCASISMADGGHNAASLYQQLAVKHLSPLEYRVMPRCPLPLEALDRERPAIVPPLIKGYLRAGAWVCGDPAWDPDFNTADLPILLPMRRLNARHARHFGPADKAA